MKVTELPAATVVGDTDGEVMTGGVTAAATPGSTITAPSIPMVAINPTRMLTAIVRKPRKRSHIIRAPISPPFCHNGHIKLRQCHRQVFQMLWTIYGAITIESA